mmetsp:Transcript_31522/g.78777  ORF Transcript_31522/g.78777 Transcript_31522/m.78777 type:complete len:187 (-) Transcript_31522:13-573(-)
MQHFRLRSLANSRRSTTGSLDLKSSTDDIASAYRKVPSRFVQHTTVAVVNPATSKVVLFYLPGSNFGGFPAVLNFCSIPTLITHILRVMFAIAEGAFFDDAIHVDPAAHGDSAQKTASWLYDILGWAFKPTKSAPPNYANPYLGLVCDLTLAVTRNLIDIRAKESTRVKALSMLCTPKHANPRSSK